MVVWATVMTCDITFSRTFIDTHGRGRAKLEHYILLSLHTVQSGFSNDLQVLQVIKLIQYLGWLRFSMFKNFRFSDLFFVHNIKIVFSFLRVL